MTAETPLLSQIRMAVSRLGARLFRNNVGAAWQGRAYQATQRETAMLQPGDVVIHNARRVVYGLAKGSGDLIGWNSVIVTPEMVGQLVAIFLSLEAKGSSGKLTVEQMAWLEAVQKAGGIAGVARSTGDAERIISAGVLVDT